MAVELTKVALWIEALEPGRPLAFFDAQIRCGDSLIGVFDRSMLRVGLPDEAYKPLTGDDKELCSPIFPPEQGAAGSARSHPQLFQNWSPPEILTERDHRLREMAQDDLASVEAKALGFADMRASDDWQSSEDSQRSLYLRPIFTWRHSSCRRPPAPAARTSCRLPNMCGKPPAAMRLPNICNMAQD